MPYRTNGKDEGYIGIEFFHSGIKLIKGLNYFFLTEK
jgi:hypothetical protein